MAAAVGAAPHHLLIPEHPNHVWHMDLTLLQVLWFRFTVAAILDGFSRRLLQLHVYARTPRQRDLIHLLQIATKYSGAPRFLITDHGTQFRGHFHTAMERMKIRHVKGRVRAPNLNGKVERAFRTFRIWWRLVLCGLMRSGIQRRLDNYQHWYNVSVPSTAPPIRPTW
jgi:transposase InsO family protein